MSEPKILTPQDMTELCMIAEDALDVLSTAEFYCYDNEGNRLAGDFPEDVRRTAPCQTDGRHIGTERWNFLHLSADEAFRRTEFPKLREMPVETIQARYLADFLPKVRNALRKGTMGLHFIVSDEVPDSRLDELITMTWLAKLIWWTTVREANGKGKGEGEA